MKPQDVVVALSLCGRSAKAVTYPSLAADLGLSASETHAAVARLMRVGIVNAERQVVKARLLEFLVHGLKYVFPAEPAGPALGIATGAATPFFPSLSAPEQGPWVWPWPEGDIRGLAMEPLHPKVPGAARRDRELYEMLALIDLLRAGRTREQNHAIKRFEALLR